jgi:hypothetical protein
MTLAETGTSIGRRSHKAGMATAGAFSRLGRTIASSF